MTVRVLINGRVRYVETPATPESIIWRAGFDPANYQVCLESGTDAPDMLLQALMDLKPGMSFFTLPRFINGG